MTPETEYFLTDGLLEATGERKCYDHYHHADNSSNDGKSYNKPRKWFLIIEGNTVRNKTGYIQKGRRLKPKIAEKFVVCADSYVYEILSDLLDIDN